MTWLRAVTKLSVMATRSQQITRALAFGALQAGFAVGERIAPATAAVYARKLWFRVPPAPPRGRRSRGVEPDQTFTVTCSGAQLPVHAWGQGQPVMLLHGWSGWWQQYSVWVRPLVEAGFRVLAWDAPSHGESPPGRYGAGSSGIPDLSDALEAVARSAGPSAGIVAHSGGAMAATLSVLNGLETDRLALIAPSISAQSMISLLRRRLGWGPRTIDVMLDNVAREYGVDLADFEVLDVLERASQPVPPILIIHDDGDTEAPPEGAERLAAAWPGSDLVRTTGLGHYKVLWDQGTVNRVITFLRQS